MAIGACNTRLIFLIRTLNWNFTHTHTHTLMLCDAMVFQMKWLLMFSLPFSIFVFLPIFLSLSVSHCLFSIIDTVYLCVNTDEWMDRWTDGSMQYRCSSAWFNASTEIRCSFSDCLLYFVLFLFEKRKSYHIQMPFSVKLRIRLFLIFNLIF